MAADTIINGFMVVRKPEHSYTPGYQEKYLEPRKIGDIIYSGIDRMQWDDIDTAKFERKLPDPLKTKYTKIENSYRDWYSLVISTNFKETIELLNFANQFVGEAINEIITVHSLLLTKYRFEFGFEDALIEWLGYDIVSLGQWSLIKDGVYLKPAYFKEWISQLNPNGLFASVDHFDDYCKHYYELSIPQIVEPLGSEPGTGGELGEDIIRVGRVIL